MFVRWVWPIMLCVPSLAASAAAPATRPPRAPVWLGPRSDTVAAADRDQLMAIEQMLLNGVASGDTAVWSRYLLPECVLTNADGVVRTKAQVLQTMHPLPPGYSGTIRMEHPVIRVYEATAVVAYGAVQHEVVYGQSLTIHYQTTDTYTRTAAGWRMLSSHSFVVPRAPAPVAADPATLSAYVGRYALDSSVVYEVVQHGDRLFGRWPGAPEEELIPVGAATFMRRGVRGERIFQRDAAGRVARMVDRLDGNDLVWTRVP